MAINGKIALFRMSHAADTETTLTDKIEFSGDAVTPDTKSGIINFKPSISRRNPDNPLPHANDTDKQDTGYSGNTYTFTAFFNEENGRALGIERLRDWIREDQTTDEIFDHGRIGLRNNFRPEFNLTPNNESGYKIVHFELSQDLLVHTMVTAIIVLEHSGKPGSFGV